MPVITIHMTAGCILSPREALVALRAAAASALSLEIDAFTMLWRTYPNGEFVPPSGRGDQYALIVVQLLAGRSEPTKVALGNGCIQAMIDFGVSPGDIDLCLIETGAADWFVAGRPLRLAPA